MRGISHAHLSVNWGYCSVHNEATRAGDGENSSIPESSKARKLSRTVGTRDMTVLVHVVKSSLENIGANGTDC